MSTQVRDRVIPTRARSMSPATLPFGLNAGELIAAVIGIALLVWVVVYYMTSLRPQQDRLRTLESEASLQQKSILDNAVPPATGVQKPADMAKDAVESLESFKNGHLKPFSSGRIDLIKEVNALAKKHSVTLTSGIDMGGSLDETAKATDKNGAKSAKNNSVVRKKSDEINGAFPSVSFRFTVFGQYSQIRSFISDLEREKQFLVINAINLSNQEARATSRRGREGVSGIMLTIEMVAYFQPT